MASTFRAIACLGNPGTKYRGTRHNAGFLFAEHLRSLSQSRESEKNNAILSEITLESKKLSLIQPQTFMNRSGEPLRDILQFYKIAPGELIVVHDELDVPLGHARWKMSGGDGGHNGIKSIAQHLSTPHFLRLRIGIGRPPLEWSQRENGEDAISAWVLGNFSPKEKQIFDQVLSAAESSLRILLRSATSDVSAIDSGLAAAQRQLHTWQASGI
jgi:PTH1 family peptidyl-tRNA hydrolase